jgi:hypothetical protein
MANIIDNKKQKLTYLKWQDAHSDSGWHTKKELEDKISEEAFFVEEVGWIVYEDKKEIHMVSRRCSWDKKNNENISDYGLYQRIPKTWVIKRKEIKI